MACSWVAGTYQKLLERKFEAKRSCYLYTLLEVSCDWRLKEESFLRGQTHSHFFPSCCCHHPTSALTASFPTQPQHRHIKMLQDLQYIVGCSSSEQDNRPIQYNHGWPSSSPLCPCLARSPTSWTPWTPCKRNIVRLPWAFASGEFLRYWDTGGTRRLIGLTCCTI